MEMKKNLVKAPNFLEGDELEVMQLVDVVLRQSSSEVKRFHRFSGGRGGGAPPWLGLERGFE